MYLGAVSVAALGGASIVADTRVTKLLVAGAFLGLACAIRTETLIAAWLFAAPLVQGPADGHHHGHSLYTLFFLLPPLILLARLAKDGFGRKPSVIDALPALYFAYALGSAHLFRSHLAGGDTSLRSIYSIVGIGVLAYYVIGLGKLSPRFPMVAIRALLWAAVVVALLALVDAMTAWNPWHTAFGQGSVHRATSTFKSPFDLGTFLGVATVFALAALLFGGPRPLRLPALMLIPLALPATVLTYSRGPIIAEAAAIILLLVIASRTRWRTVFMLFLIGTVVYAAWGEITSRSIYTDRFGVTSTVSDRVAVEQVSVRLVRKRPILGWGYGTFDQAKLTVPTQYQSKVAATTSHDTFLTVLVELGLAGLALLVLPWVRILGRSIAAVNRRIAEPWLVAGCASAVAVYVLGAVDYDTRFFPLVTALPWIAVGLARTTITSEAR